jgi:hypothetical protein
LRRNNDGQSCIAACNSAAGIITINSSTPRSVSFNSAYEFGPTVDPREIAVADLNGDGRPDFAVVNGDGSDVYTFQNFCTNGVFGQRSFGSGTTNSTGGGTVNSIRVVAADIDGDGRPDLAIRNFSGTNVVIFQNVSHYQRLYEESSS